MRFPRMLDDANPTELRAKAQRARKLADRAYSVSADELVDRLREVANELESEADALERQQNAG